MISIGSTWTNKSSFPRLKRWPQSPFWSQRSRHGCGVCRFGTLRTRIPQCTWLLPWNSHSSFSYILIFCRCTSVPERKPVLPWKCPGAWSWQSAVLCIFVADSPPCCNNCSTRIFNCRASLWRSTRSTFWGSRSWCTCSPEEGVGGGRGSFEKWCAIHAHHLKIPSSPRSEGQRGPCSAPFWKPSSPIRGRLSASATLTMRTSSWTWFLNFGYSSSWINIMKIDQAPLFTLPSLFPFKTRYFL